MLGALFSTVAMHTHAWVCQPVRRQSPFLLGLRDKLSVAVLVTTNFTYRSITYECPQSGNRKSQRPCDAAYSFAIVN